MLSGLSYLEGLLRMGSRVFETSQIRQREGEPAVSPRGEEDGRRGGLVSAALHAPRKQFESLAEISDGKVRLACPILRLELELAIAGVGRDRHGSLPDLDGLKMLASNVPEPRTDIGKDAAEASAIAKSGGQTFRLPHDPENVLVSSKRSECDPQLESRVDGLLESVR